MASYEPKVYKELFTSALAGVNSGVLPSMIDPNQVFHGCNVALRGGMPQTRPAMMQQTLIYHDTEEQNWIEDHPLQGGGMYTDQYGHGHLVASFAGRIFMVNVWDDNKVSEITPLRMTTTTLLFNVPALGATVDIFVTSTDNIYVDYPCYIGNGVYIVTAVNVALSKITVENVNDTATNYAVGTTVYFLNPNYPKADRVWVCQAEDYLVVQDGLSSPIIYDGIKSRRAKYTNPTAPEVPSGTAMVYTQGRLWVACNDYEVAASDLIYSSIAAPITFSEDIGASTAGRFLFSEKVTGLGSINNLDTSLGQGPVLVFTEKDIHSINVPMDREQWFNLTYPVTTVIAQQGTYSHNSIVKINSDVFYRGTDGVRSLLNTRRDFSDYGNVPLSDEMANTIGRDEQALLRYASGAFWKNYYITTVGPQRSNFGDYYHTGLAVMDFAPVSRMGQKSPPIWSGIWTGLHTTLLTAGDFDKKARCYVWSVKTTGENELYELVDNLRLDNGTVRPTSIIETRSYNFNNPIELKKLWGCRMWFDRVEGTINVTLKWRPDQAPCWITWGTKEFCVTNRSCTEDTTCSDDPFMFFEGYRSRVGFGQPPDTSCETLDNKPARNGYEFQFQITWTGSARLLKVLFITQQLQEYPTDRCDDE